MSSKATLEWSYSPAGLIDGLLEFEKFGGSVVAAGGRVTADFDEQVYRADATLADKLLVAIQARLAPAQRRLQQAVEFSHPPTLTVAHSDGKREIFLECSASVSISDHLEIQIIRNGVVIEDSEQERIERESRQALLLESHSDDLILARILASHRNSLRDPDNEFVHLYEIWDALESKFLKRHQVADALKIEFSKFGQFQAVCNRPTSASRHRGTADGALRQPSPAEYELARSIAWELVMGYAEWLSTQAKLNDAAADN